MAYRAAKRVQQGLGYQGAIHNRLCKTKTKEDEETMAINSRAKGVRFEGTLAKKLREYGYSEVRRSAQYCGNTGEAADIVNLPGLHIEAKHQEQMRLYDWMAQAKRDAEAGGGKLPAVFHKKNNCEILVTMELKDFIEIYKEYEAGLALKENDLWKTLK
jgi:hypothetical protein